MTSVYINSKNDSCPMCGQNRLTRSESFPSLRDSERSIQRSIEPRKHHLRKTMLVGCLISRSKSFVPRKASSSWLQLFQMHRLSECPVASGIPNRESHPLLTRCVERNTELVGTEWRLVRG